MMENEFRNGLIGHRVEVKVGSKSPLQILTIIDKVITHEMAVDSMADGKWIPTTYDMYMVMNEAGVVDMIAPHTIGRVIRPHKEVVVPAEPYDLNNMDHLRRIEYLLKESGFKVHIQANLPFIFADKEGFRVSITAEGVCLLNYGARMYPDVPFIPLSEWIKNPTILSLRPKD